MIKLPKGYKAVKDSTVGISYVNKNGNIVFQHPKDSDVTRRCLKEFIRVRRIREKEAQKLQAKIGKGGVNG